MPRSRLTEIGVVSRSSSASAIQPSNVESLATPTTVLPSFRDRSGIDGKYKWNLADIYPDLRAWRTAKETVTRELAALRSHQGKLGSSAQLLADTLETASRLDKEIARLSVYAGMLADQDTREAGPQGMQQ